MIRDNRARLSQKVGVVGVTQERAARDPDGSNADCPEQRRHELRRIGQADEHALLARDAERTQCIAGTVDELVDRAVRPGPCRRLERDAIAVTVCKPLVNERARQVEERGNGGDKGQGA